jgi:hypothetical protein
MPRLLGKLVKQAERMVSDVAIGKGADIASKRQATLLFLYVKSTKTAGSINSLLQGRRWEDALILLRSLLENLICYRWLKMNGDAAVVRFARFECVAKLSEHIKSREATIFKRDPEEFDYLAAQAEIEQELMRLNEMLKSLEPTFDLEKQKDLDSKGLWAGQSVRQMAEEIDKSNSTRDLTWTYDIPFAVGSEFVHPNPAVIWSYLRITNGRMIPLFKATEGWGHEIDVLACHTLFEMARFANEDFQLGKSKLVQQLRSDLERLGRREVRKQHRF